MFVRVRPTAVFRLKGVRFFYGKTIPDHTLKFVQVFHRHGDRSPLKNYCEGTDKEQAEIDTWKSLIPTEEEFNPIYSLYKHQDAKPKTPCDNVFGRLTYEGIQQMQEVGKQLRKFYFEEEPLLTDESFNSTEVSLRTTCRKRTLHSLQSMLTTLFPITEYKESHPIIKINTDDTCCLNPFDENCKSACAQRMNSYDWQEYLDKMKEECLPIVEKSLPYFSDPNHLKWTDVMDYVITRFSHLLELDEDLYNIFPKIYKHNTHKFQILYNTPKCLKAFTDGLFAMIKREADGVINGTTSTKLSVYSCHDTTIIPMLNVLTPFRPNDVPPYASNICIEYWQNQFDNSIDVAMRYNGEYEPIFIEHYIESIIIKYEDFCKTISIPKYLVDVMRDKNRIPEMEDL